MRQAAKLLITATTLVSLCTASFAQITRAQGKYRYVPDIATVEYCNNHKIVAPKGELVLRENFTFTLAIANRDGVDLSQGLFSIKDDLVSFQVNEGRGEGLPHVMRLSKRGLNGRGAAFSLIAATGPETMVSSAEPPATPISQLASTVPAPEPSIEDNQALIKSLDGTWCANRASGEDATIRFTIKRSRWSFSGLGVSSSGVLEPGVAPSSFILLYKTVDGRAAEKEMRRTVIFDPITNSFMIEGCEFRRSG